MQAANDDESYAIERIIYLARAGELTALSSYFVSLYARYRRERHLHTSGRLGKEQHPWILATAASQRLQQDGSSGCESLSLAAVIATAASCAMQEFFSKQSDRGGESEPSVPPEQPRTGSSDSRSASFGWSLVALFRAIEKLQGFDPDMADICRLRYFGRASMAEISVKRGIPQRTLERRCSAVSKWLKKEMSG